MRPIPGIISFRWITPERTISSGVLASVDAGRQMPDLVERCDAGLNQIRDGADSLRVVILDTEPDAGRIAVTVEITERSASTLFLGEPHSFRDTLILERAGDVWLIAEVPWPIYCWEA